MTCMRTHFTIIEKSAGSTYTHPNEIAIDKQFNACEKKTLWVTMHWGREKKLNFKQRKLNRDNYTWHQRDLTAP